MKILIQMTYMCAIGGIETAMYQFARRFGKDYELEFVINAKADGADAQLDRLRPYGKVTFDPGREQLYGADIALVFTPIMQSAPWQNIVANKVYQVIHSDLSGLKELPQWADFTWTPPQKLDGIISVSETAQKGLKKALGLDSIVIENVFDSPSNNRRVFCFMSRSTEEKGFDKALELMDKFEQAGKDYLFIIASQIDPYGPYWERIRRNPRYVYANANIYTDSLIRGCDYLVSLSSCESWGYSIREALANGVAVIGSKGVPEIERVVKDGKNGYLIDRNLTDVDSAMIDKIFDKVPVPARHINKIVDKRWEQLFKGELRSKHED